MEKKYQHLTEDKKRRFIQRNKISTSIIEEILDPNSLIAEMISSNKKNKKFKEKE